MSDTGKDADASQEGSNPFKPGGGASERDLFSTDASTSTSSQGDVTQATQMRDLYTHGSDSNDVTVQASITLQSLSQELHGLIGERRGASEKPAQVLQIDQRIAVLEQQMHEASQYVIPRENPNAAQIAPGVYQVRIPDATGKPHAVYGGVAVRNLGSLSPDIFPLAEQFHPTTDAAASVNPDVHIQSWIALAGTTIQDRLIPYSADIDFTMKIDIEASDRTQGFDAMAQTIREIVARSQANPNFELFHLDIWLPVPKIVETDSGYERHVWTTADMLDPQNMQTFAEHLTRLEGRRVIMSGAALVDGNYVDVTCVFSMNVFNQNAPRPAAENLGDSFLGAYIDQRPSQPTESLGVFAQRIYDVAMNYVDKGQFLKAAKRLWNYANAISDFKTMERLKSVFSTQEAHVSQQVSRLEAIRSMLSPASAIPPRPTSRILTAEQAGTQLRAVASAAEPLFPQEAEMVRQIASEIMGDSFGLITPNADLSLRLEGTMKDISKTLDLRLAPMVASIVETYKQ